MIARDIAGCLLTKGVWCVAGLIEVTLRQTTQWRIQDFQDWGPTSGSEASTYYSVGGGGGGESHLHRPLRSTNATLILGSDTEEFRLPNNLTFNLGK